MGHHMNDCRGAGGIHPATPAAPWRVTVQHHHPKNARPPLARMPPSTWGMGGLTVP